jgi:hypothetical protein
MFNISLASALGIVLRTAAVYLVVLAGLRLSGKREIGQMTVFDLVILLLIANAVQNAMVGPDTSLAGGVLAAVVLLLEHGADPGLPAAFGLGGHSALHEAAREGDIETVHLLLSAGMDPEHTAFYDGSRPENWTENKQIINLLRKAARKRRKK